MKILPWPKELQVYVTLKCNHECECCYTNSSPSENSSVVNIQVVQQIIELLSRNKLEMVILDGGEPLLAPEAVSKLIEICKMNNVAVKLRTNGEMLADSVVFQELIDYKRAFIEISTGHHHANQERIDDIVKQLGALKERTTLVKYFEIDTLDWAKEERESFGREISLEKAFICRYGRASSLPFLRQKNSLLDLPVCRGVGHKLSIYPDGTLWACAGYIIPEIRKVGNLKLPLYWGTPELDKIEEVIEKGRQNVFLRALRIAGHYGVQALCQSKDKKGETSGIENDMAFDHICEACRHVMNPSLSDSGFQNEELEKIEEKIGEAWKMRQLLHNVP